MPVETLLGATPEACSVVEWTQCPSGAESIHLQKRCNCSASCGEVVRRDGRGTNTVRQEGWLGHGLSLHRHRGWSGWRRRELMQLDSLWARVAFLEGRRSNTGVCSGFPLEGAWHRAGAVLRKASLDTAAVGHYSRLCPTGCTLLKLIRQQKLIPVLGHPAEPPGFLGHTEAAGAPGRLVFALVMQPALGTSSSLLRLLLAFCWRVGRKGDLFRILQVLVPFESSHAHGCSLAEIQGKAFWTTRRQELPNGGTLSGCVGT